MGNSGGNPIQTSIERRRQLAGPPHLPGGVGAHFTCGLYRMCLKKNVNPRPPKVLHLPVLLTPIHPPLAGAQAWCAESDELGNTHLQQPATCQCHDCVWTRGPLVWTGSQYGFGLGTAGHSAWTSSHLPQEKVPMQCGQVPCAPGAWDSRLELCPGGADASFIVRARGP